MLYKESAIAVTVAVMLVAASILGGFSALPAFAAHDDYEVFELASEGVSQASNATMHVDAIDLTAKKSTMRTNGELTIQIVQDGSVLDSATMDADDLHTGYTTQEIDLNEDVEGSFEVVVKYQGTGLVTVSEIDVVQGTETAENNNQNNNQNNNNNGNNNNNSSPPPSELEGMEVASKTVNQGANSTMSVDDVEFDAKKSTSRTHGTLTAAVVQNDAVLATQQMDIDELSVGFEELEFAFGGVNVTGDFEVVFMAHGTGFITIENINVVGETEPAANPPSTPPADELPTAMLTVAAEDEDGNALRMFITVYKGFDTAASGYAPLEVELDDGEYVVYAHDYDAADTHIHFLEWKDSNEGQSRPAHLTDLDEETFTAIYSADGTTTAGNPDADSDGVPDSSDACPAQAETMNGFQDSDGCPDTVPPATDGDGDGIADSSDACPAQAETVNGFQDSDGCPDTVPPATDGDGDSIADSVDLCPAQAETVNGFQDSDGCPDTVPTGSGSLTVYAHRIPSEFWGASTFSGVPAGMWFVLYNSTGWIVTSDFYNEIGTTVSGLNEGETYYVYATDCDECHGSTHDVVFEHWEDSTTENPRGVTTGSSAHAYYAYDPDP